jgi:hypothetical protein
MAEQFVIRCIGARSECKYIRRNWPIAYVPLNEATEFETRERAETCALMVMYERPALNLEVITTGEAK